MTQVVLPCLGKVDEEPDTEVRRRSTQFLVDIARDCQSQHCQDVLNLLRSVSEGLDVKNEQNLI